jgi:hypothetical protein
MKNFLVISLLLLSGTIFGQGKLQHLGKVSKIDTVQFIQLSGIVITDSLERVPFVRVKDLTTSRGALADYYGYFALVVHPGDTIEFSSLGHKSRRYIVSDTTKLKEISLVQMLPYDTITTDPVDVYPWPSREQFANAFVNMEIPDDDIVRARHRLSPQEMAFVGALLSADGGSSYSSYRAQQNRSFYTRGQGPQNNFLNPAAWNEFLQGFGTGKYQISQ